MAVNTDLFDLVHSLSKSEKRYFKRYASMHAKGGYNQYVRLFDSIEAQQEYDENDVRRRYEAEGGATHFSEAKRYLYTVILKALHQYHLEGSVESRIQMLLHQASILFGKKLYRQYFRTMEKARRLAVEYEHHGYVMEALRLQYRLLLLEHNDPAVHDKIDGLFDELFHYNALQTNHLEYWSLHAKLFLLMKSHAAVRTDEELRRYRDIMDHPLMCDESAALTPTAKTYYYLNHAIYRGMLGDHATALRYHRMVFESVCSSRQWMEPHTHAYIPALYNLCLVSIKACDREEFRRYYAMLSDCTSRLEGSEEYRLHVQTLSLMPHLYIRTGEFDRALAAMKETECAMARFDGRLRLGLESYINFLGFSACFGVGDYHRSIDYLNRILDKRDGEVDRDLLYAARLAFLIVQFELRHYDLLEYLLKSTYRFLLSRRRIHGFERVILDVIRRLLRNDAGRSLSALFRRLHGDLLQLREDPFERPAFEYFDYVSWVESKIGDRSFADIVREQFRTPSQNGRSGAAGEGGAGMVPEYIRMPVSELGSVQA